MTTETLAFPPAPDGYVPPAGQLWTNADAYRRGWPVDEATCPDPIDRWEQWFLREAICAFMCWCVALGGACLWAWGAIGRCKEIRDAMCAGQALRPAVLELAASDLDGALEAVQREMPPLLPPERASEVRQAVAPLWLAAALAPSQPAIAT